MVRYLSWIFVALLAVISVSCDAAPTPAPAAKLATATKPAAQATAPAVAPAKPAEAAKSVPPVSSTPAAAKPAATAATPMRVKFAVNPQIMTYLPFYYGMDKGYFKAAGVDVEIVKYSTSAAEQIPLLLRGDFDLLTMVPAPGMFNAVAQGFKFRLLAALGEARKGSLAPATLVVVKDVWDSGAVRELKDIKGKRIDGASEGSPISLAALSAIEQAGLTKSDVVYTYKGRAPADMLALVKQKAVDIQGMIEPLATQTEREGLGVRWLRLNDLAPWYQQNHLASSEQATRERPEAIKRFVKGWIQANRDIIKAGDWTPDIIGVASKWTGLEPDVIKAVGPLPYMPPDGKVSIEALKKTQDLWIKEGNLVKQPIDVNEIVDTSILDAILKEIGPAQ